MPAFANIAAPLSDLTKKNERFKWGQVEQDSFDRLKHALLNSKAIAYFREQGELVIKTDASKTGFGAILLQKQDGDWRIVATTSRRLSSGEKSLGITHLEGEALVDAVRKFRPYIYGRKVKVIVDHCALCCLAKTKPLEGKLARWAIALSEFDLTIEYRSGKRHLDVDCLSRQPVADCNDKLDEDKFIFALIPLEDYRTEYKSDDECKNALQAIHRGDKAFTLANGYIYRNDKLLVPLKFRDELIATLHAQGHPGEKQTIELIERSYTWDNLKENVKSKVTT